MKNRQSEQVAVAALGGMQIAAAVAHQEAASE